MSATEGEPVLVVPSSVVLPEAARARLERQYAHHRPPLGVVAAVGRLSPGSSVTTAADRAAMAPVDAVAASPELVVAGAVLLAPGVEHTVDERTVHVTAPDGATLLVDDGAAAFDRDAEALAPEPPGDDAHPPFRWRPIVLFLAGRPDAARATIASALADALIDHDLEPRVAAPTAIDAAMLTSPLPADGATVTALRPDVVVALDPDAVELAERHAATRSMVVVLVDEDLGDRIELAPWTVDHTPGRLRARIGERVDPASFAALVNRLCSGPPPEPPNDTTGPDDDATEPGATAVTLAELDDASPSPPAPRFVVIDPSAGDEGPPRPLLVGLVDHFVASGWVLAGPDAAVRDAPVDLVLVGGAEPTVAVGLSAAGDVVNVVEDGHDADADALVHEASATGGDDLAICGSAAIAARLRSAGITAIAVPRLRTRAELTAFAAAHDERVRPAAPTFALVLGDGAAADAEAVRSIGAALDRASELAGGVAVVVVGPPGSVAPVLAPSTRVVSRTELGDPVEVAGWTAAVWLPGRDRVVDAADARRTENDVEPALVTLALAGVPVVMATGDTVGRSPLADRTLAVDRPGDVAGWAAALTSLLDDDRHSAASARARRVATAAHGDVAAALVVQRVRSWLGTAGR